VSLRSAPTDPHDEPARIVTPRVDWFSATAEGEGLPQYLAILRSRVWLILLVVGVCVATAVVYLAQAEKVYEAQADLLITPVPRDNVTLIGLGLPRESSDPSRDVETMARLIRAPAVSGRVIKKLNLDRSPRGLLGDIRAEPVAQSNVVTITAQANDAELAARIANAFGNASVEYRTQRMREQIDIAIPALRKQIAALGTGEAAGRDALLERLRDLESLRAVNDPTLRVETPAQVESSPVAPKPKLTIIAALLGGLLLGAGVALGSQLLDPRLRQEDQLRRYRIPILARIPLERRVMRQGRGSPLVPEALSSTTRDAYLLLGATLSGGQGGHTATRSVLVTGPTPGDGKTTSALNLAIALAEVDRVVLVEGDSRRPVLANALHLRPKHGVTEVIARRLEIDDALVGGGRVAPRLRLLLQRPEEATLSTVITPAAADWLVRRAHVVAPWLVFDAPPLAYVPDSLPLAKQVNDVIMVVRLGNTRLKDLAELAELLAQQGITPTGFVVVGGRDPMSYYYNR
jgi:Mrp family chromosome partitioning ATPase/capsular polysaccharide biosynthesis protein